MEKKSTPVTEEIISKAMKQEKFPKPSVSSIEFVRNFARNFKVEKRVGDDIREFVLN